VVNGGKNTVNIETRWGELLSRSEFSGTTSIESFPCLSVKPSPQRTVFGSQTSLLAARLYTNFPTRQYIKIANLSSMNQDGSNSELTVPTGKRDNTPSCRGGEIGRRARLKISSRLGGVRVQVPPPADYFYYPSVQKRNCRRIFTTIQQSAIFPKTKNGRGDRQNRFLSRFV
jgi:hypothetical protein